MTYLVINAGSSSIKFTLFKENALKVMARGWIERVGQNDPQLFAELEGTPSFSRRCKASDIRMALEQIADLFLTNKKEGIKTLNDIDVVGHRVVHGGDKINAPVFISDDVKKTIKDFSALAPLHNPPALSCIEACEILFPTAKQVAVFDTAFHHTLPEHVFLYGLPRSFYINDKIRKYGFHGTNHKFVCTRAAKLLDSSLSELKIISCHLGNGSSITAVDKGNSIETSMGFTPLEGLIMGTRCGDIDPGILIYLSEIKGMSMAEINRLLNKESGLLGMAGINSSDLRDIKKAVDSGNQQARTALMAFVHHIRKTIGAYAAALSGLDVLVFTGGIGENSSITREQICQGFNGNNTPGIFLDPEKNKTVDRSESFIHLADSPVKILVVPANEELEIAVQAQNLINPDGS